MYESTIGFIEFVIENLLLYLIFIVGCFSSAKFIKEEDHYFYNRKKYIILSIILFSLVSFIRCKLYIRFLIFCLINGFVFNQIFEEKIKRIVGFNSYIIFVSCFICSLLFLIKGINILLVEFIVLIMLLIIDKLIYKFHFNIDKIKEVGKKLILNVIESYILIIAVVWMSIYAYITKNNTLMHVNNFVLMGISVFYIIYNLIEKYKLNKNLLYIETLEYDKKLLTTENDRIKIFKHDFNNIIQAMNGYVLSEDIPSLKTYIKKMIKDVNEIEEINIGNKYFLNNKAIANLFSKKYQKAKKENVDIKFEVMFELKLLNKYEYEIIRILGIFLDNAIEAVREEEEKEIAVLLIRNNDEKIIIVENTCTKDVDLNKIYTKDFSTKKNNTGLGLWEVKNLVDKNSNFSLMTYIEDNMFKHKMVVV